MTVIEHAARISAIAHLTQKRKGSDTPYIVHPVLVAFMLQKHGFRDEVIAAGLVHDVLEDTDVDEDTLRDALGDEIVTLVQTVSEDKTLLWRERKERYIAQVREASEEVKAISIADKIHNLTSLIEAHGKEGEAVWSHFNVGKEEKLWFEGAMLSMFDDSWKHPLIDEYRALVAKAQELM